MSEYDRLIFKLQRLYKSMESVTEPAAPELSRYVTISPATSGTFIVDIDFSKDMDDSTPWNAAMTPVCLIAHLPEQIALWAKSNHKKFDSLEFIRKTPSQSIRILRDLCNLDKHGRYDRLTNSGLDPRIQSISKVLKMVADGGSVSLSIGKDGEPTIRTSGRSEAIVTLIGDVISKDGSRIGDLAELEDQAISVIEAELDRLGVSWR